MTSLSLLDRLDARDRALFARWVTNHNARRSVIIWWRTVTHVGGATTTLTLTIFPQLLALLCAASHIASHTAPVAMTTMGTANRSAMMGATIATWLDRALNATVMTSVATAGRHGFVILALSHALVQLVKRTVSRPRPSLGVGCSILASEPDRFSFPSGHAAAAMSVAMGYALVFPTLAVPLCALAVTIGFSRVYLGVHYPGDVLVGQLLALAVGVGMVSL